MPTTEERLASVELELKALRSTVDKNTELTQDVLSLIRGFKLFAGLSKYLGYLAAAYVAVRTAAKAYFGGGGS